MYYSVGNSKNHALYIAFLVNGSDYQRKKLPRQMMDFVATVWGLTGHMGQNVTFSKWVPCGTPYF